MRSRICRGLKTPPTNIYQEELPGQRFSRIGEILAARHLLSLNWQILDRNWRSGRYAEIDIVAREGKELVFVEVKSRLLDYESFGTGFIEAGFECLHPRKRHKLIISAQCYMAHQLFDSDACRLDAIVIYILPCYRVAADFRELSEYVQLHHVRNIFA